MDRKRGHLEMCRDILKFARAGTGITAIVYGANLNFHIANKYIKQMEARGLITVEVLPGGGGRTKLYTTSEEGLAFIKSLDETMALFNTPTPPGDGELILEVPEA